MTKQTEKLLPCPFCGSDDLGFSQSEYCSTVICRKCKGCLQRSNFGGAYPAWNTRAQNPSANPINKISKSVEYGLINAEPFNAAEAVFQQFKYVKPRLNRGAIGLICQAYENHRTPNLFAEGDTIESLRAENELLKKLFDDASMSAFCATSALLDKPNLSALDSDEAVEAVKKKIIIAFLNMNKAVFDDTAYDIAKAAIQAVKGILGGL